MKVAVVIHEGVEVLDFSGPGEVFATTLDSAGKPLFEVYTVNKTRDPIVSQGFLTCTPTYDMQTCPQPNILVIPGGNTKEITDDEAMMTWLAAMVEHSDIVLTVCTGAFALAKLGVLDGRHATTWHGRVDRLREQHPEIQVHTDKRFVDNGKYITTAGVSAGIDGSLHLVGRLHGLDTARATARYMEYDKWAPDAGLIVSDT